jgi:hypothetical protein
VQLVKPDPKLGDDGFVVVRLRGSVALTLAMRWTVADIRLATTGGNP